MLLPRDALPGGWWACGCGCCAKAGGETGGEGSYPADCGKEGGRRAAWAVAPKLLVEITPVADKEACRWTRDRE